MSRFIAHTISFSKDYTTFKLKGGDSNVVPRYNEWTGDIPIDKLYYNLNGGMIELNGTSEKNCFIRSLVREMDFGGEWDKKTDYYHMKSYDSNDPESVVKFDNEFITRLKDGLSNLRNNGKYIIHCQLRDSYIYKVNKTNVETCWQKVSAMVMGKYRALEVVKSYKHVDAIPVAI